MEPKHLHLPDIGHSRDSVTVEAKRNYSQAETGTEERSVKKEKKIKLQELENDCNGNTSRSLNELDTSKEEQENRGIRTPNDLTATVSQSEDKNAFSFSLRHMDLLKNNNLNVKFQKSEVSQQNGDPAVSEVNQSFI